MHLDLGALGTAAVALLAALTVAGCGKTEIDIDKAAQFIDDAVQKQVGAQVKSVKCPDSVEVKAGSSFACVVSGSDGSTGDAKVTQRDDEGNMTVNAPFLHPRDAERAIQEELRKRSRGATVGCPEIIVVEKGAKFDCDVSGADATTKVLATQTDARGNFTYRIR